MKTVVYDLIDGDLKLWSHEREIQDTYPIDSLVNGENKEILYRFALTIHTNRGGGEFYTSTDTFRFLKNPAILLQFNLPEALQQAVTEDVIYRDNDINPRHFGQSNEFWTGRSSIREIFAPANFAGFWYKPEADKEDCYFVSLEEFKQSIASEKSFAERMFGFWSAPRLERGGIRPVEGASSTCIVL
ncbi:hypothetical protein Lbir_2858 [Legionella birminghamensis]|uniref:Uncharacterized protein n=1 Tax=Legionella birminghamensis TaxID=28083 RepID=A0A378I7M0_9GAMM|nr:hypothetical protein [Legionella birminghamensis]KTC68256.1 hypothetical protein Lbir_2858 [Legionella birminghamensis]STX31033.1 Uncharacterised protein [Legionella birminghamensis]